MNTKIIHGHKRRGKASKTYTCWRDMIRRCCYPKAREFARYGGRGITVCARWRDSFENFLADMGESQKDMTIERIDSNGNYELSNCRWIHKKDQQKNTCRTIRLTLNGRTQCRTDWERELGLTRGTIKSRMRSGWTVEQSLQKTLPHRKEKGV